jgi:hypothetical protein
MPGPGRLRGCWSKAGDPPTRRCQGGSSLPLLQHRTRTGSNGRTVASQSAHLEENLVNFRGEFVAEFHEDDFQLRPPGASLRPVAIWIILAVLARPAALRIAPIPAPAQRHALLHFGPRCPARVDLVIRPATLSQITAKPLKSECRALLSIGGLVMRNFRRWQASHADPDGRNGEGQMYVAYQ